MKRHAGPPTFESRIRGLMLGLALGAAVGSRASDISTTGRLQAGAGTQFAAWTTEGLMRMATRYGGFVIGNPTSVMLYAYKRWAMLRGGRGTREWFPLYPSTTYRHADGLSTLRQWQRNEGVRPRPLPQ